MQKWEYFFNQTDSVKDVDRILTHAGEDGWELVNVAVIRGKKMTDDPLPMKRGITLWNFFFKRRRL